MPGLRHRAQAGEIAFGTIDSFLLWQLSGGKRHATDVTNASRTMLFDIRRLAWDAQFPDAFGIPNSMLPEVLETASFPPDRENTGKTRDFAVPSGAGAGKTLLLR